MLRRAKQIELFVAPRAKRRGRPPRKDSGLPHLRRPPVSPDHPHHVTVRFREGTWNLRSQRCFTGIAKGLGKAHEREGFRVVHYSVQGNHMHLIVEANDRRTMSNGMRALLISVARRLNKLMGARGSRYNDRFHERALTSPNAVRNVLKYVLTNAAKHHGGAVVDPYSSGPWFAHWPVGTKLPHWTPCTGPPTRPAESWLLRTGWRRAGVTL